MNVEAFITRSVGLFVWFRIMARILEEYFKHLWILKLKEYELCVLVLPPLFKFLPQIFRINWRKIVQKCQENAQNLKSQIFKRKKMWEIG